MKRIYFLLVIISFSSYSAQPKNKILKRDILQYSQALETEKRLNSLIKDTLLEYNQLRCGDKTNRNSEHCNQLSNSISSYRNKLRINGIKIHSLVNKIRPYLNSAAILIDDVEMALFNILPNDLNMTHIPDENLSIASEAAICLSSIDVWTPKVSSLFSDSMQVLKLFSRQRQLANLKSLSAASSDDCRDESQTNCWKSEHGKYFYVTASRIQISEDCFNGQDDKNRQDFPSDPNEYIRAVNSAANAIESGGCYSKLNPYNSKNLSDYIRQRKPKILCKPDSNKSKKACAHAYKHASYLTLSAPAQCGNLAGTIFHELLHLGGQTDNLATHNHNNHNCRSYDAVYHCEALCFSDPDHKPSFLNQLGCNKCVSEKMQAKYCGKMPSTINLNFQSCGSGVL